MKLRPIVTAYLVICITDLINSVYVDPTTMKTKSKSILTISLGMVLVIPLIANEIYMNNAFSWVDPASSLLSTISNEDQSADNIGQGAQEWQDSFDLDACEFSTVGANSYFILEPGYNAILESQGGSDDSQLVITVLDETEMVNGIETRVVEERETEDGELTEISKNYFAICNPTSDVFYFGEDVDMYQDGQVVNHEGSWLAGTDNAKPGLIMPGSVEVGMKYYQEIAPGIAEDRAEIIDVNDKISIPAGDFEEVLKIEESNPLEPGIKELKYYVPQIGLVQDEDLVLISHTDSK